MHLTRFDDAHAFSARTEAVLTAREAENNLILGLTAALQQNPHAFGDAPPYLAVVEADDQVVAAAVRTPPYRLTVSGATAPEALRLIAADVHAAFGDNLPGVSGPVPHSRAFAEQWAALTGCAFEAERHLRIYQLTRVNAPTGVPGHMRRATLDDRDLVRRWLIAFNDEALEGSQPFDADRLTEAWLTAPGRLLCLWEDGEPVSMAGATGPTPNGIRIAAVYTPPERRRRGYASACVAALSQLMLDQGRKLCFLFTDLANPTSNHIYQVLGYEPVCDVDEFKFVQNV